MDELGRKCGMKGGNRNYMQNFEGYYHK